ncbi:MAG: hypothetical protein DMG24_17655 [Acidobacteria bacterium]|nr:MAG: hypothetical protein DMG24_17655 [Acidobacteriota bacterium]
MRRSVGEPLPGAFYRCGAEFRGLGNAAIFLLPQNEAQSFWGAERCAAKLLKNVLGRAIPTPGGSHGLALSQPWAFPSRTHG